MRIFFERNIEDVPGVTQPRNSGRQHVERVAGKINDTRIWKDIHQRFDLGTESRVFGHKMLFSACGIKMTLDAPAIELHNAFAFLFGDGIVKELIRREFIEEGEHHADEERGPDVQKNVLILLRFKEARVMEIDAAKSVLVDVDDQFAERTAEMRIHFCKQPCDLALRDGRRDKNVPGAKACKIFLVTRKQAMQECGAAAEIPQNEERAVHGLLAISREEEIVQPEA